MKENENIMKNIVRIIAMVCLLVWVAVNFWFICSEIFILECIGFSALAIPLILILDSPLDIKKSKHPTIQILELKICPPTKKRNVLESAISKTREPAKSL